MKWSTFHERKLKGFARKRGTKRLKRKKGLLTADGVAGLQPFTPKKFFEFLRVPYFADNLMTDKDKTLPRLTAYLQRFFPDKERLRP